MEARLNKSIKSGIIGFLIIFLARLGHAYFSENLVLNLAIVEKAILNSVIIGVIASISTYFYFYKYLGFNPVFRLPKKEYDARLKHFYKKNPRYKRNARLNLLMAIIGVIFLFILPILGISLIIASFIIGYLMTIKLREL